MARGVIALAATGMLLVAGCGGGNSDREQVGRFVSDVNAIQKRSGAAFNRANRTYVDFSKGKLGGKKATKQLTQAEDAMRRTRDSIAALDAPTPAKELQRRLIALYDADAALAHESTLLASFVPASVAALKPLGAIGTRLTRQLRSATTTPRQIAALRRYDSSISRVIRRLQPLKPPPLLLDRHHQEVAHLVAVRRLAVGLVDALTQKDSRRTANLLLRFRKLNTGSSSAAISSSALAAYNNRSKGVQRALQSVARERSRLEKTLR